MKFSSLPFPVTPLALAIALMGAASISSLAQAQQVNTESAPLKRENAAVRFGVEKIKLPADEEMGMLGSSYLVEVARNTYFGVSAYGAVTGQRGGFYTAGGELAWGCKLAGDLHLVTGMYVGGGGGGAALVGGGLMLRPHVDLMWNFGGFRAGISASNVRFPSGHINSNQIGFMLDFGTQFLHTDFAQMGQPWSMSERSGIGFDRVLMFVGTYQPRSGSTTISGVPMQQTIGYVGARMEHKLTQNLYWGIETTGAGSGGVAGYAEFLGTAGAEVPLWNDRITLGTRLAVGMGGGGAISVGGGLLTKAGVYATANLTRDMHVSLEGGLASSPNGTFRANYGTLALHWDLDHPHGSTSSARIIGNEWVVGNQHYVQAARNTRSKLDMDSITLKLNRFVSESFYLSGQAHSAYSGEAGGYSVGLVGAGYRTSKNASRMHVGAELLAGAGAGGGVATEGGFLTQPIVYAGYDLTKSISARLGVGKIKAVRGELNSTVVDFGMSFAFGAGKRN